MDHYVIGEAGVMLVYLAKILKGENECRHNTLMFANFELSTEKLPVYCIVYSKEAQKRGNMVIVNEMLYETRAT